MDSDHRTQVRIVTPEDVLTDAVMAEYSAEIRDRWAQESGHDPDELDRIRRMFEKDGRLGQNEGDGKFATILTGSIPWIAVAFQARVHQPTDPSNNMGQVLIVSTRAAEIIEAELPRVDLYLEFGWLLITSEALEERFDKLVALLDLVQEAQRHAIKGNAFGAVRATARFMALLQILTRR